MCDAAAAFCFAVVAVYFSLVNFDMFFCMDCVGNHKPESLNVKHGELFQRGTLNTFSLDSVQRCWNFRMGSVLARLFRPARLLDQTFDTCSGQILSINSTF